MGVTPNMPTPKVGDVADKALAAKVSGRPGDCVSEGEMLMRVETDKANAEAPSPMAGAVTAMRVDEVATAARTFAIER